MRPWTARLKTLLARLVLAGISVLASLIASELAFRALLFSDLPFMKRFRVAELYAYYETDDYWKLYFLFGGKYKPPATPHPLLGWVGSFDGTSYMHSDAASLGHRRPVLLYGDSFAACAVEASACFQGLLNNDGGFAAKHWLLNYGVGGYGVDQISLLYRQSIGRYADPFVILSILTEDLERSVLSVRTGQKPYYRVVDHRLVLSGTPMESRPERFFFSHPPDIRSYLFRMFVYSERPPLPFKASLRPPPLEMRSRIETINEYLILEIVRDLRARNVDHVFLIFHTLGTLTSQDDWRGAFLSRVLESSHVPYLSSNVMLKQHAARYGTRYEDYFREGDGHPNAYQNGIIADELKTYVLRHSSGTRR